MTDSGPATSLSRAPRPDLRPFVELVWASAGGAEAAVGAGRELVLPTGALHLVVRLEPRPLRVFRGADDAVGFAVGAAVIGGARAAPYLRDISTPVPSVGALLRPGAAGLLIGAPAGEFSGAHTPLEAVWGDAGVARLRDGLCAAGTPARRLDLFEAALAARLPPLRRIDPRVAQALAGFAAARPVAAVAREVGASHRHFTQLFREAVGLTPKTFCRLRRFGRALDRLTAEPGIAWADLAAAEGYADQPHFARDFRAFAGLSPGDYRRRAPAAPRHVPL
ncbi:MAG: helix-turn-helix domain-containing protein [Kiloniellaceae bacterium]